MSTRTRHWLVILVCLGIPISIIWTGVNADSDPTVDVELPGACSEIYRLASSDPQSALEAATLLAGSSSATPEEKLCGEDLALTLSEQAEDPAAEKSEPIADPKEHGCLFTLALVSAEATSAASQALLLIDDDPDQAEQAELCEPLQLPPPDPDLPGCNAAARALLTGDTAAAVTSTQAAVANAETTADDAQCLTRVLAVVTVPEDEPPQTVADWTFDEANRVVRYLTQPLEEGGLELADDDKTIVAALAWVFMAGLLLVALRQFIRWRREREAGPVVITKIDAPKGDDDATALAEVMRDCLAGAGVFPSQQVASVGEVVVDVTEVASAAGELGWVGKMLAGIKSAVTIKTGYHLSAVTHHDATQKAEPCRITVQLDLASGGQTAMIETYGAASYRDAAATAAYETYLWLAEQREVRRRIPAYVRWTSAEGLQRYHEALEAKRADRLLVAETKLDEVFVLEPGNVLVQLALADVCHRIATGSPSDRLLRSDRSSLPGYYLKALRAALRAVAMNPKSAESRAVLAVLMSYVSEWKSAWDPATKTTQEVVRLLGQVKRRRDPDLDPGTVPAGATPTMAFDRHFLLLAERQYRRAYRYLRWHRVIWTGLALDRRRAVGDQLWPFRRARFTSQAVTLGALEGTKYLNMAAGAKTPMRRATAWAQLWRIRLTYFHGFGRHPLGEDKVRYNLASAYANKADWKRTLIAAGATPGGATAKARAAKAGRTSLDRLQGSYELTSSKVSRADLDFIVTDPDFDSIRTDQAFVSWISELESYDPSTELMDAWKGAFRAVASGSLAAEAAWIDHALVPVPLVLDNWTKTVSDWCAQATKWVGDDLERWSALGAWSQNAADSTARATFEAAAPEPAFNGGRAMRTVPEVVLPSLDDAYAEYADLSYAPQDLPALWAQLSGFALTGEQASREFLVVVTAAVAARDAESVVAFIDLWSSRSRLAWWAQAHWSCDPEDPVFAAHLTAALTALAATS